MHVLLIRSDLPESPEVLLLSGLLTTGGASWVPTPEAIACKLLKLWAWVAEHGAPDSDSVDYVIPLALVEPLEQQIGCPGLVAAMCDPRVDWCARRPDAIAFCRFAEWNGPDAMKRRGDQTRARRSRERSKARILRSGHTTPERETYPKTSAKAHANCDARHASSAPSIDVDVDVPLENSKKTSTTTSNDAPEPPPPDPMEVFAAIRTAFRSPANADADQVAKDRETAWKAAAIVADRLGLAWLDRVIAAAAKERLRKPYAYLWRAIERRLADAGDDARQTFARLPPPPWNLEAIDTAPPRMEPPEPTRPTPPSIELIRGKELRRFRVEMMRRGITGDELISAVEKFDKQLTERHFATA